MGTEKELREEFDLKGAGLKEGTHWFHYRVTDAFFTELYSDDVLKGDLKAELRVEKQSTLMTLFFNISGTVRGNCDRCLETVHYHQDFEDSIVVKFTDEDSEDTDEIIYISRDFEEFNVAHIIYEMIKVRMPIKMVHESISDCDGDMIAKLHERQPGNDDDIDPRWADLIKLKN